MLYRKILRLQGDIAPKATFCAWGIVYGVQPLSKWIWWVFLQGDGHTYSITFWEMVFFKGISGAASSIIESFSSDYECEYEIRQAKPKSKDIYPGKIIY
jgi:hypothetical protein